MKRSVLTHVFANENPVTEECFSSSTPVHAQLGKFWGVFRSARFFVVLEIVLK